LVMQMDSGIVPTTDRAFDVLQTCLDELARMRDAELRAAASWLDARLRGARYRTLVHGDAKTENFCFNRDLTAVAAVDFQYVGRGCGMQDVAYFMSCLDESTLQQHAEGLLGFYFDALRHALGTMQRDVDTAALEVEWRALYPIAWADFCRFMDGWAPSHPARVGYAARMVERALAAQS
ncbi:MAG TPA: phosphotransferase, partial [Polyangiales bacterium]|nr:phosphotransferase [Polyangiales bacterium]